MDPAPGKGSSSLKRSFSSRASPFRAIFDQSFAKLLQLNFSSVDCPASSCSDPAEDFADIPNEYRNLLLSLSENRCDHVLWIRSLRNLNWRGDGDFSFTLDRCGMPSLKSGEYKLNLCHECLDQALQSEGEEARMAFLWEGDLEGQNQQRKEGEEAEEDSPKNNFAHFPMSSVLPIVEKCARMMRQKGQITKGATVLVYMPCTVQLFLTIFAAARIGAALVYVNAAINQEPEDLAQILLLSRAQLIFTIDGFQREGKLQRTKHVLDEAILMQQARQQARLDGGPKVIVVRHLVEEGEMPSRPLDEENGPNNEFEVPMLSGRDYFWSDLMAEMTEGGGEAEVEWMDSEDVLFHAISKIKIRPGPNKWHFESYTVGQIALLVQLLASKFEQVAEGNEMAQTLAARRKELLRKRQSLQLVERKSLEERVGSIDEDWKTAVEEEEETALARKGSTRSQPGLMSLAQTSTKIGQGKSRKKSQPSKQWEQQIIWPMVEANDVLFLASLFAIVKTKSSLFMSELPPSRNDPLKVFRLIQRHKISQLLMAQCQMKLLSRAMDSSDIWSGEEDKIVRSRLPSLRCIFSLAKVPHQQGRGQIEEDDREVLEYYIEQGPGEEGQETRICHLFC